jgi:hypothetical protein
VESLGLKGIVSDEIFVKFLCVELEFIKIPVSCSDAVVYETTKFPKIGFPPNKDKHLHPNKNLPI